MTVKQKFQFDDILKELTQLGDQYYVGLLRSNDQLYKLLDRLYKVSRSINSDKKLLLRLNASLDRQEIRYQNSASVSLKLLKCCIRKLDSKRMSSYAKVLEHALENDVPDFYTWIKAMGIDNAIRLKSVEPETEPKADFNLEDFKRELRTSEKVEVSGSANDLFVCVARMNDKNIEIIQVADAKKTDKLLTAIGA